ncbi:unnamed protein product [Penicillium salamii]|nr:unnamed protein product [Penicillium salamii]CAG8419532.1 unnamed protein product [Penicillium salamii]
MVSCEAGGFVFASPLALRVKKPLALIRDDGKVPPPTYSVSKVASHISDPLHSKETKIELERNAISKGASVVVVDDVLASGRTMCAMLRLLEKAHVRMKDVSVLVVAEFLFTLAEDTCISVVWGRSTSNASWFLMVHRRSDDPIWWVFWSVSFPWRESAS